jgi:hypothetical protein
LLGAQEELSEDRDKFAVPNKKKEISRMRSGTIIAVLAALAIVIFGIMWYSSDEGNVAVRQETDDVIQEEAAAPNGEPEAVEDTAEAAGNMGAQDDGPIVVGDEITDETITVESATEEPVILDPEQSSASVEVVEDGEAAIDQGEPAVAADTVTEGDPFVAGDTNSDSEPLVVDDASTDGEPVVAGDATEGATPAADASATIVGGAQEAGSTTAPDLEGLLTPANFDPDEIAALIDDSDGLSNEQRSSLRALVNGASNNPAMVEGAVESIRAALDLPPLE